MAINEAKVKFTADTKGFNKEISEAKTEMGKLRAEFAQNADQIKATGVSVEALEEKHRILSDQYKTAQRETEALSGKLDVAKKLFGENSTEATRLETQLIKAQTAEAKLQRAVEKCAVELQEQRDANIDTRSAMEKLTDTIDDQQKSLDGLKGEYSDAVLVYGKNSKEAKELAREIGSLSSELQENKSKLSAAEKAADKLDNTLDDMTDSVKEADGGFSTLDGAVSVFVGNTLSSLVDGIGNAVSTFANLSDETQEYREDIGKLKTAWESAGKTTELATGIYKDFYSVLGEEDRSIEAVNHLAKFVETEEDLAKWTDICAGVWGTFGDSLPIEGLTEASNETAKVGQLTGVLADALNWAGVNEEEFQEKLEKCNSEQERSELITETLNGLYADAAKHYKENNKSIIAARKATSDYTDTMADLGETIEPLNTEITELKTEFAKELSPVIKRDVIPAVKGFIDELDERGTVSSFANIIGNLAKTVLPPFAKIVGFAADNFGTLVTVIGTAVVVFKTFSAAMAITTAIQGATTAVAGLSAGVGIATTVQTAWNAAMMANPIGAVVTAIGLLVGGLVLLASTQEDAIEPVNVLTEEERQLAEQADETARAFRDQQSATTETVNGIMSETGHIQSLAQELQTLADAKGRVKENDEARVQFILNELNEALGTEYTMTDGVVQKYGELKKNIDGVIQSKTVNALLEASNADYVAAIQAESDALHNVGLKETEYRAQKDLTSQKEQEYLAAYEELQEKIRNNANYTSTTLGSIEQGKVVTLKAEWNKEKGILAEKESNYNTALADYGNYSNTIMNYEEAQTAALQGNYDRAVEILKSKSGSYGQYADSVDQSTRDAVDALYKEAIDAGIEADRTKRNFEKGVKGYTKEMVAEAEKGYSDALNEWATAYDNAHTVGTDLGGGLKAGMEGTRYGLIQKAKSMVQSIIGAFRKEADSHSPSRKMISFGEDMGEGGAIGLENKTDRMTDVAKEQMGDLMGAYSSAVTPLDMFSNKIGNNGGYSVQHSVQSNAASVVEHKFQNSGFMAYVHAVERLADRAIELNINGHRFATATAADSDRVNGNRMALSKLGLAIG